MYQTVMILLVTAVVTIITTVITVRFTMTGRVLSQGTSKKLRAAVKRFWLSVLATVGSGLGLAGSSIWLFNEVSRTTPVTRMTILTMCGLYAWVLLFALAFGHFAGRLIGSVLPIRKPTGD